jgi:hypothetical protein
MTYFIGYICSPTSPKSSPKERIFKSINSLYIGEGWGEVIDDYTNARFPITFRPAGFLFYKP